MLYNISNGKKLVADLKAYKSTASTVPQGATTIGDMAYYTCKSLTSVSLPSTLTSIGAYAFYGCTNLKTVNYAGTVEAAKNLFQNIYFSNGTVINCSDGTYTIS